MVAAIYLYTMYAAYTIIALEIVYSINKYMQHDEPTLYRQAYIKKPTIKVNSLGYIHHIAIATVTTHNQS